VVGLVRRQAERFGAVEPASAGAPARGAAGAHG